MFLAVDEELGRTALSIAQSCGYIKVANAMTKKALSMDTGTGQKRIIEKALSLDLPNGQKRLHSEVSYGNEE